MSIQLSIALIEPAKWSLLAHVLRPGTLVNGHTFKARSSEMMPFLSDVFHWGLVLCVVHADMAQI